MTGIPYDDVGNDEARGFPANFFFQKSGIIRRRRRPTIKERKNNHQGMKYIYLDFNSFATLYVYLLVEIYSFNDEN